MDDGKRPAEVLLRRRFRTATAFAVAVLLLASCSTAVAPPATFGCPGGDPLIGIYNPSRLKVIDPCRWFRGTVQEVDHRSDGDLHILLQPDAQSASMLNVANVNAGGMVAEIVPGQSLPSPAVGEHVAIFGTYVLDQHNDWNEIHPVFAWKDLTTNELVQAMPPVTPEYVGDSND